MTIQGIATNVQALLQSTALFKTVLSAPPTDEVNFAGYPSACHYYTDAQSDYATVSQNRRVFQYTVELYIVANDDTTETQLFTNEAYPLIDAIMQLFDASIDLSSQTLGLARACDILRPTPSRLERVTTPDGNGLMMTIHLFCEADIAFR